MAKGTKTGGRKVGTPNKATADIKAIAQKHGPAMIAELVRIAMKSDSDQARASAADKVLDRAYGKAPQAIAGDRDNPIEVAFTFKLDRPGANT